MAYLGLTFSRMRNVSHSGHLAGIIAGYAAIPLFASSYVTGKRTGGTWKYYKDLLGGARQAAAGLGGYGAASSSWRVEDWHVAVAFLAIAVIMFYGRVANNNMGAAEGGEVRLGGGGRGDERRNEDARRRAAEASLNRQRSNGDRNRGTRRGGRVEGLAGVRDNM